MEFIVHHIRKSASADQNPAPQFIGAVNGLCAGSTDRRDGKAIFRKNISNSLENATITLAKRTHLQGIESAAKQNGQYLYKYSFVSQSVTYARNIRHSASLASRYLV